MTSVWRKSNHPHLLQSIVLYHDQTPRISSESSFHSWIAVGHNGNFCPELLWVKPEGQQHKEDWSTKYIITIHVTWPKDVLERHDFREIVSTFILSKKYFSPRLSRIECYRVLQKTSEKQICILLNFRYDHWDITNHNIFICNPS